MADEPVEPIKQKICVLKASIHCEGCKRKVKKLLLQLQGVESVDVDTKLQKVTVTGDVEPHSLINKLAKSGKNAELWPQKIHGNGNTKKEEVDNPSSINVKSPEQPPKTEVPVENRRGSGGGNKSDSEIGGGGGEGSAEADCIPSVKITAGIRESKSQEKRNEENCSTVGEPAKAAEDKAVEKSNGGGESGTSGKKKKKRGQSNAKSGAAPPPEQRESGNLEPPPPANHSPPRGHHYYAPPLRPQPVYGVSYNTAYPTSSYTTSYYASPPPYSYACMHPEPVAEPAPPSDPEVNPRQPLDSFEIFSDENPNGCFVM